MDSEKKCSDCGSELVDGVCAECEKRKKENTVRPGSVGFGMSDAQRKSSFSGRGRGGWFNQ